MPLFILLLLLLLPHRVEKLVLPDGSEQLTGCNENCLNRLSFIHCDPRTCPCGQLCSNKPFHLLKAPQLDVFLTENRGHGVRMTQPLRKGNFVVEYAGEVRGVLHLLLLCRCCSVAAAALGMSLLLLLWRCEGAWSCWLAVLLLCCSCLAAPGA
jgi:hypothetical protein